MEIEKPTNMTDSSSADRTGRPPYRRCGFNKPTIALTVLLIAIGLLSCFLYKSEKSAQENGKLMTELSMNISLLVKPNKVNASDLNGTVIANMDLGTRTLANSSHGPNKLPEQAEENPAVFVTQLVEHDGGTTNYECREYCKNPSIWHAQLNINNTTDLFMDNKWTAYGQGASKDEAKRFAAYDALIELKYNGVPVLGLDEILDNTKMPRNDKVCPYIDIAVWMREPRVPC